MAARGPILGDHVKKGKILVPPFVHSLGALQEVSWAKVGIPEFCWIALVQQRFGHHRGVEIITALGRAARQVKPQASQMFFASISNYRELNNSNWEEIRTIMPKDDFCEIKEALKPLVYLYPSCPLRSIFEEPSNLTECDLTDFAGLISSLFSRNDRNPMMIQATAVWLERFRFIPARIPQR